MQYNLINKINMRVSAIAFGTVKLGRNQGIKYPQNFNLPSDKEVSNLLALTQELGINLLDTAPAYGSSESRLGQLLTNRQDWLLMSKAGETFVDGKSSFDFSYDAICASAENSLKKLQTDYLDILLLHPNDADVAIMQPSDKSIFGDAVAALIDLKKQGKVRAIGISPKSILASEIALNWSDFLMLEYNITLPAEFQAQQRGIISKAQVAGIGIFIKKALASGHLANNEQNNHDPLYDAFKFIYEQPISSMILGSISANHWQQNCEYVEAIIKELAN